MFNISIQFLAFPLFNYSINNYWREQNERELAGTSKPLARIDPHPMVNQEIFPYPAAPRDADKKTRKNPAFLPVPENESPNDFSQGWE